MLLNPDRVTMNYTMADVVRPRPNAISCWLSDLAAHA